MVGVPGRASGRTRLACGVAVPPGRGGVSNAPPAYPQAPGRWTVEKGTHWGNTAFVPSPPFLG